MTQVSSPWAWLKRWAGRAVLGDWPWPDFGGPIRVDADGKVEY